MLTGGQWPHTGPSDSKELVGRGRECWRCPAGPGRATSAMLRHLSVSQLHRQCVNGVAAAGSSEDSMARSRSNASAAWHVPGVKGIKADDRRHFNPQEGKSIGVFWGEFLKA